MILQNNVWLLWSFLILSGTLLTIGDLLMYQWIKLNNSNYCLIGLILYFGGVIFLALSYRYKYIAVATCITCLLNIIFLSIISYIWLEQKLSVKEMIAICLAISSIIIFEWK